MKTKLRNHGLGIVTFLGLTVIASAQLGGGQGGGFGGQGGGQGGGLGGGSGFGAQGNGVGGFGGGAQGGVRLAPRQRVEVLTIRGKIGEWINVGRLEYRVLSATSGLRSYRQQYNQAGRKLHPGFSSDRLAVVEVEVRNNENRPIEPPIFMAALTDSDGVRGTDWMLDTRQQAFLTESGRPGRRAPRIAAAIGDSQMMKLAVVFSVSAKARPTVFEFSPENFRDMPFGQPGRPSRNAQPGAQAGGPPPPREEIRVVVNLSPGK